MWCVVMAMGGGRVRSGIGCGVEGDFGRLKKCLFGLWSSVWEIWFVVCWMFGVSFLAESCFEVIFEERRFWGGW